MARWEYEYATEKPKLYKAIRCMDCKRFLGSKAEAVKHHKGHDVAYTDLKGNRDE